MPQYFTSRGFAMYTEFEVEGVDETHNFSVQESSLATEHKVWVGYGPERAHLSVEEARLVRNALTEFIGDGVVGTHTAGCYPTRTTRAGGCVEVKVPEPIGLPLSTLSRETRHREEPHA